MREFEGKVAVVTGAASGIGRALADRFAREGMKVVLADIEEDALEGAVLELKRQERDVIGVLTDVSSLESVEELAQKTIDAYGGVHILCNNAGVSGDLDVLAKPMRVWEHSMKEWEWTFGVNFWGVVHGVKTFLPIMLEQDEEGHVVNTSSLAGLLTGASAVVYGTTKHAVTRLSEALDAQLRQQDAKVKASVLCPGLVETRIFASGRNRPDGLWDELPSEEERAQMAQEGASGAATAGIPPAEVAEMVLEGIKNEQFYILTLDGYEEMLRVRAQNTLEGGNLGMPRSLTAD